MLLSEMDKCVLPQKAVIFTVLQKTLYLYKVDDGIKHPPAIFLSEVLAF